MATTAPSPAKDAPASGPEPAAQNAVASSPRDESSSSSSSSGGSGIDAYEDCTPYVACLAQTVSFVVRSLSPNDDSYPTRLLTRNEAIALSNAGLVLVSMWEYLPEDPGKPAYFTYQQGQSDGTTAYTNAAALRQPQGTPIYFAIDYDFDEDYVHGPLTQYFQGIKDAFTAQANPPAYTVGAYGSGLELTWLLQQGLSEYSWLAGISSDWQGNATFTAWNLNQTAEEAVCGVESADEDVSQGDFGKWQLFS